MGTRDLTQRLCELACALEHFHHLGETARVDALQDLISWEMSQSMLSTARDAATSDRKEMLKGKLTASASTRARDAGPLGEESLAAFLALSAEGGAAPVIATPPVVDAWAATWRSTVRANEYDATFPDGGIAAAARTAHSLAWRAQLGDFFSAIQLRAAASQFAYLTGENPRLVEEFAAAWKMRRLELHDAAQTARESIRPKSDAANLAFTASMTRALRARHGMSGKELAAAKARAFEVLSKEVLGTHEKPSALWREKHGSDPNISSTRLFCSQAANEFALAVMIRPRRTPERGDKNGQKRENAGRLLVADARRTVRNLVLRGALDIAMDEIVRNAPPHVSAHGVAHLLHSASQLAVELSREWARMGPAVEPAGDELAAVAQNLVGPRGATGFDHQALRTMVESVDNARNTLGGALAVRAMEAQQPQAGTGPGLDPRILLEVENAMKTAAGPQHNEFRLKAGRIIRRLTGGTAAALADPTLRALGQAPSAVGAGRAGRTTTRSAVAPDAQTPTRVPGAEGPAARRSK